MATVTPPMTTSQFVNALDRGIRKHYDDQFQAKKPKRDMLFRIGKLEDYNQEEFTYAGFGPMQVVSEAAEIPVDSRLEGFKTTYTGVKYASAIEISKEMIEFDKVKLSDAASIAEKQVRQVLRAREKQAAAVFNNGFSTSYTSYGDGKPLFSTLHTRADGAGSRSNADSSGTVLSHEGLDTMRVAMAGHTDLRGELIEVEPKTLLVPRALEQEAIVITKSTNKSGTADNDMNMFNGRKEYYGGEYNVVVWDYLTSTTAWFLLSDVNSESYGLQWLDGWMPIIGDYDEYTGKGKQVYRWYDSYHAATGWGEPMALRGSKGDEAAYSS